MLVHEAFDRFWISVVVELWPPSHPGRRRLDIGTWILAQMVQVVNAVRGRSRCLVRRGISGRALRHRHQWPACIADAKLSSLRRRASARYRGGYRSIVDHGPRIPSSNDARGGGSLRPVFRTALRPE